jgi:type IV secretion system protein VirB8
MRKETAQHAFEDEIFFSLRKQRNNWAKMAIASMAMAIIALLGLVLVLPLKDIRPYVVLVDKTTGEAEKVVEVRPASIEQQDAVLQAELVSYVSDREIYDKADSVTRITDVMGRSEEQAAETLAKEWDSSSPNYPPTLYKESRVLVTVKSISITPSEKDPKQGVASVRIVKQREEGGRVLVERPYIVTVGYAFKPAVSAALQTVWKNPLGFTAVTYRVDAETVDPAK